MNPQPAAFLLRSQAVSPLWWASSTSFGKLRTSSSSSQMGVNLRAPAEDLWNRDAFFLGASKIWHQRIRTGDWRVLQEEVESINPTDPTGKQTMGPSYLGAPRCTKNGRSHSIRMVPLAMLDLRSRGFLPLPSLGHARKARIHQPRPRDIPNPLDENLKRQFLESTSAFSNSYLLPWLWPSIFFHPGQRTQPWAWGASHTRNTDFQPTPL